MYGNVLEWCHDLAEQASPPRVGDRPVPLFHVMRSGTYRSIERENRSAKRYWYDPSERSSFFGLRVARTIPRFDVPLTIGGNMGTVTNLLLGVIVVELAGMLYLTWRRDYCREDQPHRGHSSMTNYCLWRYRQGQWHLVENRCLPGFQPGDPPARAGTYPDEMVRKPATRID